MPDSALRTPVDILLVEDNPSDALLLERVLEESRLRTTIHVVRSGEAALLFLRREPPYQQAPRPRLILLDLNLPGLSGLDVLRTVQQDPLLRAIPVVVLTVSGAPKDILAAYDEGARAFITKPGDPCAFELVVQAIDAFWLETAQLPAE
jgi:chemotaxis family two-component system response regulator Rcp1